MDERVIFHLDVDYFYVACELLRRPDLHNKPVAVTQFNSGGFVAVNEVARQCGIRKGDGIGAAGQAAISFFKDRPDALMPAVMKRCPDLIVLPMDTTYYRQCTSSILQHLRHAPCWKNSSKGVVIEKSSMDDFYIDATEHVRDRQTLLQAQLSRNPNHQKHQGKKQYDMNYDAETFASASEADSDTDEEDSTKLATNATNATTAYSSPSILRPFQPSPCPTFLDVTSLYATSTTDTTKSPPVRFPDPKLRGPTPSNLALAAAIIAHELRSHVRRVTGGITLSCGIGDTKLTARLISKRSGQPNSQTLLLPNQKSSLLRVVPIRQVPTLRQMQGALLTSTFNITTLSEIAEKCTANEIVKALGVQMERAEQILRWSHGIDHRKVIERGPPQSISVEKSQPPLKNLNEVREAVAPLCRSLITRLEDDIIQHSRVPTTLTVHWRSGYGNNANAATHSARTTVPHNLVQKLHRINGDMKEKSNNDVGKGSAFTAVSNACMLVLSRQTSITRIAITASSWRNTSSSASINVFFGNSSKKTVQKSNFHTHTWPRLYRSLRQTTRVFARTPPFWYAGYWSTVAVAFAV